MTAPGDCERIHQNNDPSAVRLRERAAPRDTRGVGTASQVKTSATPNRGGRPSNRCATGHREVGVGGGASITWSITAGRRPPATPDGTPLVLEVSCPSGVDGRHEVTLAPDWSMQSPHDLVAERVLVAFGGSSPCLKLEQAIAAARLW